MLEYFERCVALSAALIMFYFQSIIAILNTAMAVTFRLGPSETAICHVILRYFRALYFLILAA